MNEPSSAKLEKQGGSCSSEVSFTWINPEPIGAGELMVLATIGISRELLHRAIKHIESLKEFVEVQLETRRLLAYSEFQEEFENDGKWEAAPMVKISDRSKVSRRRT